MCQGGERSQYGQLELNGLYLYDASLEFAFKLLGGVNYAPPQTREGSLDVSSNWWSEASSLVERSVIMDDYVRSISGDELTLNHSAHLERDVAVLLLPRSTRAPSFGVKLAITCRDAVSHDEQPPSSPMAAEAAPGNATQEPASPSPFQGSHFLREIGVPRDPD